MIPPSVNSVPTSATVSTMLASIRISLRWNSPPNFTSTAALPFLRICGARWNLYLINSACIKIKHAHISIQGPGFFQGISAKQVNAKDTFQPAWGRFKYPFSYCILRNQDDKDNYNGAYSFHIVPPNMLPADRYSAHRFSHRTLYWSGDRNHRKSALSCCDDIHE